jgi:hypothetical protein
MTPNPKVFISHASEDKERFVIGFATKLREKGIDAWVDKWEIFPGDSLVDRIFEEGIKNAQAMIIVLSKISVQKPWVKEELNAGMVKKISGKCKLIPVVIDDCEVPEALRSTVWETIKDINNYQQELDRIVSAIYGHSEKPALGTPPKYTQVKIRELPGLSHMDTVVFKIICETSLSVGVDWVDVSQIQGQLVDLGVSEDEIYESIEMLANSYFVHGTRTLNSKGLDFFQITPTGFKLFGEMFIENFNELANKVLLSVINLDLDSDDKLSVHLHQPKILIDYILDIFTLQGYIKISKFINGNVSINEITVIGKRIAREIS